jgi:hypothetical protein
MVKDGLQLGYGSLLEAISPFVMDAYLSQIETGNTALRSNDDTKVKEAFGLNTEELKSDFVNNYLLSNISGPLLYTFNENAINKAITIKKENNIPNEVKVDWNQINGGIPKRFIRLKGKDAFGNLFYRTFISISSPNLTTQTYSVVETKGSNQQNPIGFMFGERPTYKAVRQSIKLKNSETKQDAYANSIEGIPLENYAPSKNEMIQMGALNDESANIEANEFGVNINGNNIANISALETMLNAETKEKAKEVESDIIETGATTTLFDSMSDLERELYNEFADEMKSDYSAIENFWDANIQKNTKAKENLRVNNNVLSLEDLIDMYNNGIYKNQEEFIEQIKQCNL